MLAMLVLVSVLLRLPAPSPVVVPAAGSAAGEESMARSLSQRLQGRWRITEVNGFAPLPQVVPVLVFEPERLSGFAGCNAFSADLAYGEDGSSLSLEPFEAGHKVCPDDVMEQEKAILTALARTARASFAGEDGLTLWTQDLPLLRAERMAP